MQVKFADKTPEQLEKILEAARLCASEKAIESVATAQEAESEYRVAVTEREAAKAAKDAAVMEVQCAKKGEKRQAQAAAKTAKDELKAADKRLKVAEDRFKKLNPQAVYSKGISSGSILFFSESLNFGILTSPSTKALK